MKAIKLLFTFSIVLGAIVAVLYFTKRPEPSPVIEIDAHSLEQYTKQFKDEWEEAGDWDEEIFKSHCDQLRQLDKQGYDVVSLTDLNTSIAVNMVYEKILSEWDKASCKKDNIQRYMRAVDTIVAAEKKADQNQSIKIIKDVNQVYTRALALAHKNVGLTPRFDGHGWNSYDKYESEILSQKSSILNNTTYKKYLSNISEIKNGLGEISSKLAVGRTRFYHALGDKIIDYFERVPTQNRTRTELDYLRKIIVRYEDEFDKYLPLYKFQKQYANDVSNNEHIRYR